MIKPVLCVLSLSAALTPGDEVRLADRPAAGAVRTLSYRAELVLQGGELTVEMNGSPVPSTFLPELDFTLDEEIALVVRDRVAADGFERTYVEASYRNAGEMTMSAETGEQSFPWSSDGETPFLERTVRFALDDDGGAEAEAFVDDRAGDPELLTGLRGALGLHELLPEDALEPGRSWSVDGAGLGGLFEPGGDLAWEFPPEMAEHMFPAFTSRVYAGELELQLERVVGDLAHVAVQGELVRTTTQPGDLSQVPVADGTATDTVVETWAPSGTLVWNVAEHHLAELTLAGEFTQVTDTVRDPDQPGGTYSSRYSVDGTRRLDVRCAIESAEPAR